MPRLPRIDLPEIPQHLVQRGNDRRPCFFRTIDHVRYLDELREAATRARCAIHAYVLMTNHVHLLVTPRATGQVGAMMQSLGRRYVRYVNDRYRRTGTLWEGRYKACPVQSDNHLLRCYRYIELNPVRAAMVDAPGDYPWSSHALRQQAFQAIPAGPAQGVIAPAAYILESVHPALPAEPDGAILGAKAGRD